MNLDLGILWIEDSFSPEENDNLKRRIREAGFIARIDVIPNGDGIDELSRKHSLYHCYDLILLDYRLKDQNGNDLAPIVRALFPSTTILFYSGSADEQQLRTMIAEKEVEGVYCSRRERFIERTGALIDQTARALDRLSGMRGLAMRVVAECDSLMKNAVLSMTKRDPNCAAKLADLDKEVFKSIENMKEKYAAVAGEDLESRLETRAVDSLKLFKHFRRLTQIVAGSPDAFGLGDAQVERLRELRLQSAHYNESVLAKRNILGHVIEIAQDDGWILQGSNEITVSDFPEIRQVFATHIDAFREMNELIVILD